MIMELSQSVGCHIYVICWCSCRLMCKLLLWNFISFSFTNLLSSKLLSYCTVLLTISYFITYITFIFSVADNLLECVWWLIKKEMIILTSWFTTTVSASVLSVLSFELKKNQISLNWATGYIITCAWTLTSIGIYGSAWAFYVIIQITSSEWENLAGWVASLPLASLGVSLVQEEQKSARTGLSDKNNLTTISSLVTLASMWSFTHETTVDMRSTRCNPDILCWSSISSARQKGKSLLINLLLGM